MVGSSVKYRRWGKLLIVNLLSCILVSTVLAIEVNDDGRELILQAQQAYNSDMQERAIVRDKKILTYLQSVQKRLTPRHKSPPKGVRVTITVLDSIQPEIYSYVDGRIVISMGAVYAMENEAQLAGVLSHELANITEGYYIGMYQQVKAAERSERNKATMGALFRGLMDVAVDYEYERESIRQNEAFYSGKETYVTTMKNMAAASAARSAFHEIKDVVENTPAKDKNGNWVDPRLRFEPIADAQGMEYMALAGYEVKETAKAWRRIYKIKSNFIKKQDNQMGGFAVQLRQMQSMMKVQTDRMNQSFGKSGLVQTLSDIPATRAEFVESLTNLKEVKAAQKTHKPLKRKKEYMKFLQSSLLPRAQKLMQNEEYEKAYISYKSLWDKGVHTAVVAYGLAKSQLGDFAFGASEAQKSSAQKAYKSAIKLDPKFALSYRGLGELYSDWERYSDAAKAYKKYLKLAPRAKDKKSIKRKIKVMQRKAKR